MNRQQTFQLGSRVVSSQDNAAADENRKVTALFPGDSDLQGQAGGETGEVDEALDLFNQMSRQITDSYRTLESRVNQLSGRLSDEARRRQSELEAKEQLADRLTTLLDVMPAGVVVLDSQGVISQCNPAAITLLGELLEGTRWLDVIQRCFAPRRDDGHEVSLNDGRRVSIEIRSMENEPGQLILLTDLTETRRLQGELARSERLSSMGRMVASLSHQIRTPLSAAMLYGGHLCEPELDQDLRQRCAHKLMSRLHNLEQQVSDMLIFAKGDIHLAEEISVASWLSGIMQHTETLFRSPKVTLVRPKHLPVGRIACNQEALVGACSNLINNSLEAGASEVSLQLDCTSERVTLSISDNGKGFNPGSAPLLMEAFHTTKSHGTGLGLAVVNAVVHAHQGHFQLQSQGDGATAIIELPLLPH
ncbi:MAG: PAS domain-containing protein [Halomonadaceae bacterium]|nr:MAG: PAS domain-containing protein [Halomonadaceae bacterium]